MPSEAEVHLENLLSGLVKLVRAEYPGHCDLDEIATTWGADVGLTPQEVEAVARATGYQGVVHGESASR